LCAQVTIALHRLGATRAPPRSKGPTAPPRRPYMVEKTVNRYSPLANLKDIEELGDEGLHEGYASKAGSSRSSRPRDFVPITAEILHLLDRLEPDKVKQARLMTEHIAGHRVLPTTEQ